MEPEELLKGILELSHSGQAVYLVGGAVRDRLLGRKIHDFDLVMMGDPSGLARNVARRYDGAFYPLDEERGMYRVIFDGVGLARFALDFATLRAANLEEDLRGRDFTINAMALDLSHPDVLIDPLGGEHDLRDQVLRVCSPTSVQDDPVRALRAVRLELTLGVRMDSATQDCVRQAQGSLGWISHERVRDELFRILDTGQAEAGLGRLDHYGLLAPILPDLLGLKGLRQSPPHVYPGWEHTLEVVRQLDQIWVVLVEGGEMPESQTAFLPALRDVLGRFQANLAAHYRSELVPLRSLRSLLVFAALHHDCAKPVTASTDPNGRIRFFNHDERGARIAARRARILALGSAEVEYIETVISGHMRVHQLVDVLQPPGLRAIYRFFRATQRTGIDICMHTLADTLGMYGPALSFEHWLRVLRTVESLLEAYWNQPEKVIAPPRWINGDDLIREFGLTPGPIIGLILEAVREAQAVGEVVDRPGALALADRLRNEV